MFPKNKFRGSDRVIIVGSGPSAANFVAPRGVPIIAVNGAIDWLNRASYFSPLIHPQTICGALVVAAVAVVFVIAWHYPMLKNVKSEMAFCASVVWLNAARSQKYEFSRVVGMALVRTFRPLRR